MQLRSAAGLILALSLSLCHPLFATDTPPTPRPPTHSAPPPTAAALELQTIAKQLQSANADDISQALTSIKEKMAERPDAQVLIAFRDHWGPQLIELKRYDDLENLAVAAILLHPDDTVSVAQFQRLRVRALAAAGKMEDAVSAAKAYYNICPLRLTSDGISLVSMTLVHAHPEDGEIARRFRAQQTAGASTQPTTQSDPEPSVLASIKVDDGPFKEAIAGMEAWEIGQMIGKANLLLLSDQTKAAKALMQQAYNAAETPAEVNAATEGLARAIRAEDGSIGKANAWLLALKGKP